MLSNRRLSFSISWKTLRVVRRFRIAKTTAAVFELVFLVDRYFAHDPLLTVGFVTTNQPVTTHAQKESLRRELPVPDAPMKLSGWSFTLTICCLVASPVDSDQYADGIFRRQPARYSLSRLETLDHPGRHARAGGRSDGCQMKTFSTFR